MAEYHTYDSWEQTNCDCLMKDVIVPDDKFRIHKSGCLFHQMMTSPQNIFMFHCDQQQYLMKRFDKVDERHRSMEDRLIRVESLLADFLQLMRDSIQPAGHRPPIN